MLIERIIEFELRGPGPPGCSPTCTPTTGYFPNKTKIIEENLWVDSYLLLKYCTGQGILFSPSWTKSLTKFTPQIQDFKRVRDLNCKW